MQLRMLHGEFCCHVSSAHMLCNTHTCTASNSHRHLLHTSTQPLAPNGMGVFATQWELGYYSTSALSSPLSTFHAETCAPCQSQHTKAHTPQSAVAPFQCPAFCQLLYIMPASLLFAPCRCGCVHLQGSALPSHMQSHWDATCPAHPQMYQVNIITPLIWELLRFANPEVCLAVQCACVCLHSVHISRRCCHALGCIP